jgi:hypothetical protein
MYVSAYGCRCKIKIQGHCIRDVQIALFTNRIFDWHIVEKK